MSAWRQAGRPDDWNDVPVPPMAKARSEKRARQRVEAAAKQASDGAPSRNEGDGAPSRVGDPAQDGPPSQGVGEPTQRPLLAQPKWQPRLAKDKKPDKERGEVADAPLSEYSSKSWSWSPSRSPCRGRLEVTGKGEAVGSPMRLVLYAGASVIATLLVGWSQRKRLHFLWRQPPAVVLTYYLAF